MESENQNPYQAPESDVDTRVFSHETQLASRWARLGGWLIDTVIAIICQAPIYYWIFNQPDEMAIMDWSESIWLEVGATVYSIGFFMICNGYLLAYHGQTIGKRLLGTRIVDFHSSNQIGLGKMFFVRYLPQWVASFIPILPLIDALFIFSNDKRCVHDLLAGTKVIKIVEEKVYV